VEWYLSEVVLSEPTAHPMNHLHVVVDAWDDEVGEFYPDVGLLHGKDSVENGLQMASADAAIDVVAE
jgi:hypothetical protein